MKKNTMQGCRGNTTLDKWAAATTDKKAAVK